MQTTQPGAAPLSAPGPHCAPEQTAHSSGVKDMIESSGVMGIIESSGVTNMT